MAQQGDRESQTEDATEKKILDEVEKGNIPVSREAAVFATMLALLAIAAFMARDLLKSIGLTLELLSSDPGGLLLQNNADAVSLFSNLTWDIGKSLIPMLAILLIAGLASSFLQHPPRIILDRIQPDWKRISLVNGWHRIFSARGQADFIKGVCKLVFIGILMWTVVRWQRNAFLETMTLDPDNAAAFGRLHPDASAPRRGPSVGAHALAPGHPDEQAGNQGRNEGGRG